MDQTHIVFNLNSLPVQSCPGPVLAISEAEALAFLSISHCLLILWVHFSPHSTTWLRDTTVSSKSPLRIQPGSCTFPTSSTQV